MILSTIAYEESLLLAKSKPLLVHKTLVSKFLPYFPQPNLRRSIQSPRGIDVDNTGAIFVCSNHSIKKIYTNGTVKTWVGNGQQGYEDGKGTLASFNYPEGICIDSVGNLFVTEEHRVRKIAVDGTVSTVAGKKQNLHQDGSKRCHSDVYIYINRRKSCTF